MKRGLFVVAGLLIVTGISMADYVIIRINLTPPSVSTPMPDGDGMQMGMPPQAGGFNVGRPAPQAGGFGAAGANVGMPPANAGGGFNVGNPAPNAGGGFNVGMPPRNAGGFNVGMPPPNAGGGMNAGNMDMGGQPQPNVPTQKNQYFVAVVESDAVIQKPRDFKIIVNHRWGQSVLASYPGMVDIQPIDRAKFMALAETLDYKLKATEKRLLEDEPKGVKELSPAGRIRLLEWMLQHWNLPADDKAFDLKKQFEAQVDKLAAAEIGDAKIKAIVRDLVLTRDKIVKAKLAKDDAEIKYLREIVPGGSQADLRLSDHYALLYKSGHEVSADRRLRRLEHTYAGYFYWFALKARAKALTPPTKQLLCVLAPDRKTFDDAHTRLDAVPLVADGFYSRFDNVAVFCASRVDTTYLRLQALVADMEQSYNIDMQKILRNEALPKDLKDKAENSGAIYVWRAMALATVAGLEEGEIATVTQEGIQQLASATGLLPRRVQLPQAIRFGLGSFFETPKSDPELNPSFPTMWSGIGAPSWSYLPGFKSIMDNEGQEFPLDKGTTDERMVKVPSFNLASVLTDKSFVAADKADKKTQDFYRYLARSEAWAVTYYLGQKKLDNLLDFYTELGRLPRDMELSDDHILQAFGKAFKSPPDGLDEGLRSFMKFQQLEAAQMLKEQAEKDKEKMK